MAVTGEAPNQHRLTAQRKDGGWNRGEVVGDFAPESSAGGRGAVCVLRAGVRHDAGIDRGCVA